MSDPVDTAGLERAAYIHIPFCHRRCPYCDFAVVDMAHEVSPISRYVDALLAEIQMEARWGPLHAVNLGGGTPSVLKPGQVKTLLGALENRFGLVEDAEVSIEANPEDVDSRYATELREAGVNRMSLGVQSFDAEVLQALGRNHNPDQAIEAVANARAAGMRTINIDMIFGTPGESLDSWERSVRIARDLETEHLSAYALTVELGTELSRAVQAGAAAPDGDDQADKYEMLAEVLSSRLVHYEVSNWAKPGHECRYNLTTWAQGEYVAFGLGAHGHRDGVRTRNARRLDAYLDQVEQGTRPELGSEQLDEWAREKERVFLGLRRRAGVAAGDAGVALLASMEGRRFVDAGIVSLVGDRLVIMKPLLTDAVAREVLALELET